MRPSAPEGCLHAAKPARQFARYPLLVQSSGEPSLRARPTGFEAGRERATQRLVRDRLYRGSRVAVASPHRKGTVMFAPIRSHLSFSNVLALAALLLATGGVSYAASTLAPGSVGTAQLQGRSVKAKKLADHSVHRRALSKKVRRQLDLGRSEPAATAASPDAKSIHFSAHGSPSPPPTTILDFGGLRFTAACIASGGTTNVNLSALSTGRRGPPGQLQRRQRHRSPHPRRTNDGQHPARTPRRRGHVSRRARRLLPRLRPRDRRGDHQHPRPCDDDQHH